MIDHSRSTLKGAAWNDHLTSVVQAHYYYRLHPTYQIPGQGFRCVYLVDRNPDKGARVLRGGSWIFDGPDRIRCAYHFSDYPDNRYGIDGFRCVYPIVGSVISKDSYHSGQDLTNE